MVPTGEILVALLVAAAVWFCVLRLKARETGVRAARAACLAQGLQFLDDTVSGSGWRLMRDEDGRLRLVHRFRFEFSDTGDNRLPGQVSVLGEQVLSIDLGPRSQPAIIQLPL